MAKRKEVKKWFQQAIGKSKFTLSGWKKTQKASKRRKIALSSRPKAWSLKKRFISVSRALQSLANVTGDKVTKKAAKQDSGYFLKKYRKLRKN
ncbi:MAG: hypothetical protein ISS23_03970 [Nanoarchaeota archaeon]|nr:hypothetical protein [Nanoarchaeota archaeon]